MKRNRSLSESNLITVRRRQLESGTNAPMRLFVIDHGLVNHLGHHCNAALGLAREARERGVDTRFKVRNPGQWAGFKGALFQREWGGGFKIQVMMFRGSHVVGSEGMGKGRNSARVPLSIPA